MHLWTVDVLRSTALCRVLLHHGVRVFCSYSTSPTAQMRRRRERNRARRRHHAYSPARSETLLGPEWLVALITDATVCRRKGWRLDRFVHRILQDGGVEAIEAAHCLGGLEAVTDLLHARVRRLPPTPAEARAKLTRAASSGRRAPRWP